MTQADIDKLTDELIDARAELDQLQGMFDSLRDEAQSSELSWMQLRDEYSEVARALGVPSDSFWGDPLVSHSDILARAKELASFARVG